MSALQTDESNVQAGTTRLHHFGPFDTTADVLELAIEALRHEVPLLPWRGF